MNTLKIGVILPTLYLPVDSQRRVGRERKKEGEREKEEGRRCMCDCFPRGGGQQPFTLHRGVSGWF